MSALNPKEWLICLSYKNRAAALSCHDGIASIVRSEVPASIRNWKPKPAGFYTTDTPDDLAGFYELVGVANR
jgi:hypothetical protein